MNADHGSRFSGKEPNKTESTLVPKNGNQHRFLVSWIENRSRFLFLELRTIKGSRFWEPNTKLTPLSTFHPAAYHRFNYSTDAGTNRSISSATTTPSIPRGAARKTTQVASISSNGSKQRETTSSYQKKLPQDDRTLLLISALRTIPQDGVLKSWKKEHRTIGQCFSTLHWWWTTLMSIAK